MTTKIYGTSMYRQGKTGLVYNDIERTDPDALLLAIRGAIYAGWKEVPNNRYMLAGLRPADKPHPDLYLAGVIAEAKRTGRASLGGEMDVPLDQGPHVALTHAARIAQDCGYVARHFGGCRSMICISGPGLPGLVVLDWFHVDAKNCKAIRLQVEHAAYF